MRLLTAEEDQGRPIGPDPIAAGPAPIFAGPAPIFAVDHRHTGRGQVPQVAPVAVPCHHRGGIEQVGHPGGPRQELCAPVGDGGDRAQDHQIGLRGLRIVPRQPAGMQSATAQDTDQTGVVRVTDEGVPP